MASLNVGTCCPGAGSPAWLIIPAALLLSGCLKFEQVLTVYPDSSGKLELQLGLEREGGKAAALLGKKPLSEISLKAISEASKGFVGWSRPRSQTRGDFTFLEMTGYFEDVNHISIGPLGDGAPPEIAFKRARDGTCELRYTHDAVARVLKEMQELQAPLGKRVDKGELLVLRALARELLSECELTLTCRMPGQILQARGMEVEGRDAKAHFDVDWVLDMMKRPRKVREGLAFKITSARGEDLAEEMAAFRREMTRARSGSRETQVPPEVQKGGKGPRRLY